MNRARRRSGSHSSTDGGSKKPVSRSIWRKLLIAEPRRRIKIGLPILPNIPVMRQVRQAARGLLHRRELLSPCRPLMGRFPGLVGHAVYGLAALVLAHANARGVGFVLEPVGQAVAAEACEIHQIDVLDIGAGAQMFDEPPEHRGFKFRSGFVVNCHDRISTVNLAVSRKLIDLRWELSQILPYRRAKRGLTSGISAAECLKMSPWPLTAAAGLREIINDLI